MKQAKQKPIYYTTAEIAERYGITVNKVLSWIKQGELVALNLVDRINKNPRYKISADELESFELRRTTRAETPIVPRRTRKQKRIKNYIEFSRDW